VAYLSLFTAVCYYVSCDYTFLNITSQYIYEGKSISKLQFVIEKK